MVMTVTGEVAAADLGLTLPHEHILISAVGYWQMPAEPERVPLATGPLTPEVRGPLGEDPYLSHDNLALSSIAEAVEELRAFVDVGGRTVVECTPIGVGRDPVGLAAISRLTGLNIIMGTGYYVRETHPTWVEVATEAQLADEMIRELTLGVGETGIRCGFIGEAGCGSPMSANEGKVLRASARAALATGVTVNMHRSSYPNELDSLAGLDVLLSEGLAPGRIVASHCDERPSIAYADGAAERGVWIELDTWGIEAWALEWPIGGLRQRGSLEVDRIALLLELLDRGLEDRILLSQDVCSKQQQVRYGGFGYAHLSRTIEPKLREHGISDAVLTRLRVTNPARALAGAETPAGSPVGSPS
jgi:phosphotriesterase-related protein